MSKILRHVDLCAGTGAFSMVITASNFGRVVFANDIESSSKKFYDANFDHELHLGDVNEISLDNIPEHDILTAGFPCQPFSIAGERLGMNDERSNVFWSISKILEARKPRFFILENVKNLLTHDNKRTIKIIQDELERIGYKFHMCLLNTCKVTGVPQNRERIYIIGFLHDRDFEKFPTDFPEKPMRPLSDFINYSGDTDEKYYYTQEKYKHIYDRLNENMSVASEVPNKIYQYRRHIVRENKSGVCPTLTANAGTGGHNVPLIREQSGKIRKLTPRECFNLQGFPQTVNFPLNMSNGALYKLAGNAVSLPVVEIIVKKLQDIM